MLSGFPIVGPYFRPYMIWSRSRLNFCQSASGPHFSFGTFFFQWSKLRETFPRIGQVSVRHSNSHRWVLLHDVQISVSRPCHINVFQWECFFLRHIQLNSTFTVMTTDEVTLDRPEVGPGFSVIC